MVFWLNLMMEKFLVVLGEYTVLLNESVMYYIDRRRVALIGASHLLLPRNKDLINVVISLTPSMVVGTG